MALAEIFVSPTAAMLEPNFAQDLHANRLVHTFPILIQNSAIFLSSPESLCQLGGSRVRRLSRVKQSPQVILTHSVYLYGGHD